ncbi:thymidine phosphorylase-like [Mizuhopecten yessoensis]|uniref:Thymidine phosphorylase n=1 Tax=Mizuhopecten yessoensis TaxID=6573 RepID=A0A210Q8B8_MIZYE|nr:thymidine phosphorylase-like [Mizuhopecten yessoensis]OWF44978.1 Thymidine phosphorylase [Mizuhopecten yessoensis]
MATTGNSVPKSISILDLIVKKRQGMALTKEEIEYFVQGVVDDAVAKEQLGSMLMATVLKGLDDFETTCLTRAMMNSGEIMRWPESWRGKIVDKHSTGGVGDKISLVLAPILASCGMKVPMVSGRGLGHTGGTLDKLESIPGFSVAINTAAMTRILEDVGCCIVGQTETLVPADKKIYAMRDVTGTVESVGLIAASIISKKAAENLDFLILDVKCGKGSTTGSKEDALVLGTRMVNIANGLGINTIALLTEMNNPIGQAIGNALEVAESLNCLHNKGPSDVMKLVCQLGGQLLYRAGLTQTIEESYDMMEARVRDGAAIDCFRRMLVAQGATEDTAKRLCDPENDIWTILPRAKHMTELKSEKKGFVQEIDSKLCAVASGKLGAGRSKWDDVIKFGVGLMLQVCVGDAVEKGDVWVQIHHDSDDVPAEVVTVLEQALVVKDQPLAETNKSRVIEIIA